MSKPQRDEAERRVLALLRDYMDELDEIHPDGWEIVDFLLVYFLQAAPEADDRLKPWHGGARPGWTSTIAYSSSFTTWAAEQWAIRETLERSKAERRADWAAQRDDGDASDDDDD